MGAARPVDISPLNKEVLANKCGLLIPAMVESTRESIYFFWSVTNDRPVTGGG